jgi:hypothetical protein
MGTLLLCPFYTIILRLPVMPSWLLPEEREGSQFVWSGRGGPPAPACHLYNFLRLPLITKAENLSIQGGTAPESERKTISPRPGGDVVFCPDRVFERPPS